MQISLRSACPAYLLSACFALTSVSSFGVPVRILADERGADGLTADPIEAPATDVEAQACSPDAGEDEEPSRETRIARYLTGATFTGQFTSDRGASDQGAKPKDADSKQPQLKTESYTISSCEPIDGKDLYRLKVKIRYGNVDGEFPMDLRILWAGATPVITLDSVWIPGLGTFSSRVLIHQNRYAGTWQHDEKGGSLFGTIQPAAGK